MDTGLAVGNPGSGRCPLKHFPGALRSSLGQLPSPGAGIGIGAGASAAPALPARAGPRPLPAAGSGGRAEPAAPERTPRASPAHPAQDDEEEFFI